MIHAQDARMQRREGFEPYEYAAGQLLIESRRFIWVPRLLPVVTRNHSYKTGQVRFLWLTFATLRGTPFGWEAVVEEK